MDDTTGESSFQIPEIEASAESNNISNDQEINAELNPLPVDEGTTAEDNELDWDNVLADEQLNFDGNPETETATSWDPFCVDSSEGAPFMDNPNNPDSSRVEPQNHVSMDSATLLPSNDRVASTSDVPSDNHPSVQNQPYPETGNYPQGPQGQAMGAGSQQDFSASYELNSQLFAKNLMDWVILQPNPQCQYCQLMRRTIHTNGFQDTKLEVHTYQGANFHGVLQVRFCSIGNAGPQPDLAQEIFHFPPENPEYMKHYLRHYSLLRAKEGFVLRHDCVLVYTQSGAGMSMISDPCFPGPLTNSFPLQTGFNNSQAFGNPVLNPRNFTDSASPKIGLALQRERTVQFQFSDFAQYFHLPEIEATKKLLIGSTALKTICRSFGVDRWPYRKIKSIERAIANLERNLAADNGQRAEKIRSQIENLKKERAEIYKDPQSN